MGTIMDELATYADRQLATARAGAPLTHRDAEQHPELMLEAPANNLGALFRAAYWSAVAARIALAQGTDPTPLYTLATQRRRSATLAVAGGNLSLGLFSLIGATYSPSGTDAVDGILLEVEKLAARHGVEEVASTMWLQRQSTAQEARREVAVPMFSLDIPFIGGNLDQINKSVRWGLAAIVAIVGFGALVWVSRPFLAPAARIAGQAAGDAWQRRREKRKARRAR